MEKGNTHLVKQDIRMLLTTADADLLGEIIRLNQTNYANSLDVVKICSAILSKRLKRAE